MNYAVGDLVRINNFLDTRHTCAIRSMLQYCGKIAVILDGNPLEGFYKLGFKYALDDSWVDSGYTWQEAHFKHHKILRFYSTSSGIRFRITSSPTAPYHAGTTLELKL